MGALLKHNNAAIYYETAGSGQPIVFIHAGVTDNRQWNAQFQDFSRHHRVIRYDLRGYGKSEPVAGEFTHLDDLIGLTEHLKIAQPIILVGCSMGGGMALDYALQEPDKVKALMLVGSAPGGLQLDLPKPAKFALVDEAEEAGDLELVAELETQIWFDGDRDPSTVDPRARQLAYDMIRTALLHDAKGLGSVRPNLEPPAVERLEELQTPVLAVVGANDIPFMHAAVEYMSKNIINFSHASIANAGHLPNLDQPLEFKKLLEDFIEKMVTKNESDS